MVTPEIWNLNIFNRPGSARELHAGAIRRGQSAARARGHVTFCAGRAPRSSRNAERAVPLLRFFAAASPISSRRTSPEPAAVAGARAASRSRVLDFEKSPQLREASLARNGRKIRGKARRTWRRVTTHFGGGDRRKAASGTVLGKVRPRVCGGCAPHAVRRMNITSYNRIATAAHRGIRGFPSWRTLRAVPATLVVTCYVCILLAERVTRALPAAPKMELNSSR